MLNNAEVYETRLVDVTTMPAWNGPGRNTTGIKAYKIQMRNNQGVVQQRHIWYYLTGEVWVDEWIKSWTMDFEKATKNMQKVL